MPLSEDETEKNDFIVEEIELPINKRANNEHDKTVDELASGQVEAVIEGQKSDQHLKKIRKPPKRQACKNLLFEMRSALTIEKFEEKKIEFEKLLASDDDYKSFKKYFDSTYTLRYKQWADAYLLKFGPCNTNMNLESWHSNLKHKYLGGRKQRRLNYILDKIVQYDKHQERVAEHEEEFGFSDKRTSLVLKYHKQAIANYKTGSYKVARHQNPDVLQQYMIEEGKETFFVTMKDDDPNH